MAENIGTATLTIEPVLDEQAAASLLGEVKQFEPNPRIEALAKALESVRTFEVPPGAEHIVERAEVFLAFLDPQD